MIEEHLTVRCKKCQCGWVGEGAFAFLESHTCESAVEIETPTPPGLRPVEDFEATGFHVWEPIGAPQA